MSVVNLSVLFVDDDSDLLSVMKEFTEDYIQNVFLAASVDEAMSILKQDTINVLISDFQMNGKDGVVLRQQTKDLYPDMAFVMYSGYPEDQRLQAELSHKHFPALQKPLDPMVLINLIIELGNKPNT